MAVEKPIPDGFHTITPHIIVRNGQEVVEFYKRAFGAEVIGLMPSPDGQKIMHAELKIGNSMLMLTDEFPEMHCVSPLTVGGTSTTIHLYVEDVDTWFNRAVEAGATVKMPVADMFWGDRYGIVTDPSGHTWSLATHIKDLTKEEVEQAAASAMAAGECSGS